MSAHFSFRHGARIVFALGWADFILKYRGSVLGYLWSFLGPLVQFIVILTVFRPFIGEAIPQYPLYLFLGLIMWEHFSLTTSACVSVLYDKMGMMQKVSFPRILLPLSVGWTHLIIFLTRFAIFFLFALMLGVQPEWSYILLFVILLNMTLFALGIGMGVSAYSVRFRDIPHLWGVALQILFWLTPILYPAFNAGPVMHELVAMLSGRFSFTFASIFTTFIRFQPLSLILYDARRITLYADSSGVPSFIHIVFLTVMCSVFFLAGAILFVRRSRFFVQEY
ncbi:ABC transporter permease [Candidatus Peregrinibacteria bacterium]|nr:ABC transporter permease [Candidatus Peregrinibacteria bacterium]